MIIFCLTGGIGDAIMATSVIPALEEKYGKVKVVHFEDLVGQVVGMSERFPEDELLNLADVGKYYPEAEMAVINKFRKDNDGELSYFYALGDSMLEHVRNLRSKHIDGVRRLLGVEDAVESLYDIESLRLLRAMSGETSYFADWQRYGIDAGYEGVHLDHMNMTTHEIRRLGDFAIVHDSRLPGPSGKSSYLMKAWYPNRWNSLCARLTKKMPVVQIMSGDQPLFEGAIPHTDVIGGDAVFSDYLDLLRSSAVYIGTDSWPAHAAICTKGPKFVILKGAVSNRWDHDGRYSRIIRVGNCQACEGPRGANSSCFWRAGSHQCMDLITSDLVYNVVMEEIS